MFKDKMPNTVPSWSIFLKFFQINLSLIILFLVTSSRAKRKLEENQTSNMLKKSKSGILSQPSVKRDPSPGSAPLTRRLTRSQSQKLTSQKDLSKIQVYIVVCVCVCEQVNQSR